MPAISRESGSVAAAGAAKAATTTATPDRCTRVRRLATSRDRDDIHPSQSPLSIDVNPPGVRERHGTTKRATPMHWCGPLSPDVRGPDDPVESAAEVTDAVVVATMPVAATVAVPVA